MTTPDFAKGLARIALATKYDLGRGAAEVYFDAIAEQTTAQEWDAFCRQSVSSGRFRFFPTVAEILDGLREFRGGEKLEDEASRAYQAVLAAKVWTPEYGDSWSYTLVKMRCGEAAATAFLAAGGSSAFESKYGEDKRRERFVTAYASEVRDDPSTALPALAHGASMVRR